MANGKTSKSEPPLPDVLEAIDREVGIYPDKDSQERFLRKLLVPRYIPNVDEREVQAKVAKYRLSLTSKIKGHTNSLGSGQKGGRGHIQHYGINDLFVHGPRKVLKPDFLQRQNCDFDASYEEDSPSYSTRRRSTKKPDKTAYTSTAQGEVDKPPASRLDASTRPSSLSPTTAPTTTALSIDIRSPALVEKKKKKKRKAATAVLEEPKLGKRQNTGLGSQRVMETSSEPPPSAVRPIPPLRLKNPSASTSPNRQRSAVGLPNPETSSAAPIPETTSSDASSQELRISATSRSGATSAAPDTQKPQSRTETAEPPAAPTAATDEHSIADHLGPSGAPAAPDQIRDWKVRSNVLNKDPIFPPTSKPHRDEPEIFPYGDQGWLSALWEPMKRNLWYAMWSFFNEHSIDDKAPSAFVSNPSPELRELYKILVRGEGQWEAWLVDQKMKGVVCLTQDCTIAGLFGAFVFKSVFREDLPWDAQKDLPSRIGDDMKYFEAAMRDIGHDSKNFLRNVAAKQYEDQEFQKGSVAKHAKQQANALLLTLQPHLQRLTRSPNPKAMKFPKYVKFLEDALTQAIQVKHILQASKLGPFDFQWPEAGVLIDLDDHKPWFEMPGSTHTLHTFLPAVQRVMPDKIVTFSKAEVFPWSLQEKESG
ncbi:hypothetical protein M409DRAFT_53408 [Zasmidium cellare ATCC 36951]|uniref:Uncharacterized protein n=1 Tax=Zasmidium cellare ATCC 36951 TaxID=1080233 RepID=A0A6A6CPM9_ZASCE|nr:uncharacterized protein M409DRAFT_53408 [Zasmidium cellare ATCC 36951]KAF2168090.1 hypothetical protein M409DRAFT_53408 [Zasmidium cellare ATCC 36951]